MRLAVLNRLTRMFSEAEEFRACLSADRFQVPGFKFFMLNSLLKGSPFVRGDVEDRGVKN